MVMNSMIEHAREQDANQAAIGLSHSHMRLSLEIMTTRANARHEHPGIGLVEPA